MGLLAKLPQLPKKQKLNSFLSFLKRRFHLPRLWKFKRHGIKFGKTTADKNKKSGSPFTRVDGGGGPGFHMPGSSLSGRSGGRMTSRAAVQGRGGFARSVGAPKR
jgi:hypothetical protein